MGMESWARVPTADGEALVHLPDIVAVCPTAPKGAAIRVHGSTYPIVTTYTVDDIAAVLAAHYDADADDDVKGEEPHGIGLDGRCDECDGARLYERLSSPAVEALQWHPDRSDEVTAWLSGLGVQFVTNPLKPRVLRVWVEKSAADVDFYPGMWIVREGDGVGVYPMYAFARLYRPVEA